MSAAYYTSAIAVAAAAGVVIRPFRWPEAVWAVAGALLILALGILTPAEVWSGVIKGLDVYLFLTGMMLLSELARREGLFDWVAAVAISYARGSARRLFVLIYLIGVVVTALLSNAATAVVLTPAVYAACRAARVKNPLPYLYICAFIANAASFVLPISNPANLVIFAGGEMPPLSRWLETFLLPSIAAILVTFLALYWSQRRVLAEDTVADRVERPTLSLPAKLAGVGLLATAAVLLSASAFHMDLGLPTFLAGVITTILVLAIVRQNPVEIIKDVSWGVLPLVAGLFVIVEAVSHTGITAVVAEQLKALSEHSQAQAIGIQPRQQPTGWSFRRKCRSGCTGAGQCHCRCSDRGRSGTEPVGHGLACNHPLAVSTPARRPACARARLPQTGRPRHDTCLAGVACNVAALTRA